MCIIVRGCFIAKNTTSTSLQYILMGGNINKRLKCRNSTCNVLEFALEKICMQFNNLDCKLIKV